jgi:hypothetical protein
MRLAHCPACGLVFNTAFDPELLPYEQGYENSLHFSPSFDAFAQKLAASLIRRYDLHGSLILEIGCGRGDFLCMLCEDGNQGVGFDPSYAGTSPERRGAENLTITAEPFTNWQDARPAGLVCCRHTLEHVVEPIAFLEDVRSVVERSGAPTPVYFEVPNARHLLESDAGPWDITYEHPSYFTASALEATFTAAGFSVAEIDEAFDGQFLSLHGHALGSKATGASSGDIDARSSTSPSPRREREPGGEVSPAALEVIARFADRFGQTVATWDARVAKWLSEGRLPVLWGGGSKGITFLNIVPAAREIEYVVDINPHKQGLYAPGSGQRFVAPDFLRRQSPDVIVLMNAIYEPEVRRRLDELGLAPEVVAV